MNADLIAALQSAWAQPGAGRRSYGLAPYRPIAHTSQDQQPVGDNPMWEVVRWMPAAEPYWGGGLLEPESVPLDLPDTNGLVNLGASRHDLCTRYAWSIITPGDVEWIGKVLDGRPVVEIGAGTGYWAWQLEQTGVDVVAYDPHPPSADNTFCKAGPYTTVLAGDATAVELHQDRALLMVWPPYDGGHARQALSAYRGDLLVYAGESAGGCTADDGFYDLLEADWVEVSVSPHHVTWSGIHCRLAAYQRKAAR